VEALEVHHLVRVRDDRSLIFEESNCRTLCKGCHVRRTARGE
jgi:5-methylcytosine-specific restriction endonuclease McrA